MTEKGNAEINISEFKTNYFMTFTLLFILLLSAIMSIFTEIAGDQSILGKVFYKGNFRFIPGMFIIFLSAVMFVILWGFGTLLGNYLGNRIPAFHNPAKLRGFNALISSASMFMLGIGILMPVILLPLAIILFVLFLYTVVHYIYITGTGTIDLLNYIPKVRDWSSRKQGIAMLVLGVVLLLQSISINFLPFFDVLDLIDPSYKNILVDVLVAFLTLILVFGHTIHSFLSSFLPLDSLDPLFGWFSVIKGLVVKFIVYSTILMYSIGNVARNIVGETRRTLSSEKLMSVPKSVVSSGFDLKEETQSYLTEKEETVEIAAEDKEETVMDIQRKINIDFWNTALSLLVIFFLEGMFSLIDGELDTQSGDMFATILSLFIWAFLIIYSGLLIIQNSTKE